VLKVPPPMIRLRCLGAGAGKTQIYDGEPSSSWALESNEKAFFLADLGAGVCRSALRHLGVVPSTVFISHNHTDHAAELPLVLAVESLQKHRSMRVVAAPEVMLRLKTHRMHEMLSTGLPLEAFAEWMEAPEEEVLRLETEAGELQVTTYKAVHSECCFGARIVHGEIAIGWTADSAFDRSFLDILTSKTHLAVVDAREKSSQEHASFQEIKDYVASKPDVSFLGENQGCQIAIIGYGAASESPSFLEVGIPETAILRPGSVVSFAEEAGCIAAQKTLE